ncbi:hypothetical protein EY643_11520 [Halioglobus maricola]|uniref:Uncharacterized protein n=1 Tax=Halioglobus maricola TaxID=2601894 RepID=A0A5P9NMT4_9GAMM|nr:hypothetical protein [Halioglobus maricola]QFU76238.1 hypothetical protein EY643_11520 [Halioglobus maricola]
MYRLKCSIVLIAITLLPGCNEDTAKGWKEVLANCSDTDLHSSKDVLYFGISNNLGPGTVWKIDDAGNYDLRANYEDYPKLGEFTNRGNSHNCDGSYKTSFSGGAALGLSTKVVPISGEVKADLENVSNMTVSADNVAWDEVRGIPYEKYINSLESDDPLKIDLKDRADRHVMKKALRVQGYKVILEFEKSVGGEVQAKYTGPIGNLGQGEFNPKLNGKWTSDRKLEVTAEEEFYIAGRFAPYEADGFSSAGVAIGEDTVEITNQSNISYAPIKEPR